MININKEGKGKQLRLEPKLHNKTHKQNSVVKETTEEKERKHLKHKISPGPQS